MEENTLSIINYSHGLLSLGILAPGEKATMIAQIIHTKTDIKLDIFKDCQ